MKHLETNLEKLNKFLISKDQRGLELTRLLQMYLLDTNSEKDISDLIVSNIPKSDISETGFRPIGTWHPVCQDGEIVFIRKEQSDSVFWESTCSQFSLKKEPNKKRVCFIGESVAAGMFFTPYISPSKVLANYLECHSEDEWDVIDLTRNCMNAGSLIETCQASLQLEPDFIVLLAGNNWFSDIMIEHDSSISRRRFYADSLDKNGMSGLINTYRNNAEKLVENVLQHIDGIANESTTEFIFAIPALNYADWQRRCPLHVLDNQKTSEWYERYRSASASIENGNYETGLKLGKEMIQIDGGTNATSSKIVANCLIALERFDEAYNYCVAECDNSLMFDHITSFPGVLSFVRKYKDSTYTNLQIIDLEAIFMEHSGTKILGSRFFVDYCHLNPEGYQVAMAPIASKILSKQTVSRKEVIKSWKDLVQKTQLPKVDKSSLAVSYFSVALYNTHLNRPITNGLNIEKYVELFQRAVNCSDLALDIMELYVKGRSCQFGAGFAMSESGQKLFELMNSPLDFPVAQEAPGVDALTIMCICRTLDANGRNGKQMLEAYQQGYIKLLDKGVDLTEPKYIEWINANVRMAMDSENSSRRKVPIFKSWWPLSFFTLVSDAESDLEAEITCRLPSYMDSDINKKVNIAINNQLIDQISVSHKWTSHKIIVPQKMIINGFNRLSLEWPELKENGNIINLKKCYAKGLKVEFYPVFGEVFSLIVRNK